MNGGALRVMVLIIFARREGLAIERAKIGCGVPLADCRAVNETEPQSRMRR